MIGILHGYLLEGSGSNLWTRSIIQALCKQGETIHLFCQENHPEIYDFISEAYLYEKNGAIHTHLKREISYMGKCIMHKPVLGDILPVYVWDHYEEFKNVVPMIQLSNEKIDQYLQLNIEVVNKAVEEFQIKVLHVNHAVLMSVVAQRVGQMHGIPYAVMPHGSAIEYAVKKDERFYNYAKEAFDNAKKLFVIGPEIQHRVKNLFSSIPSIQDKMIELNLGADTSLFTPINKNERKSNIQQLCDSLKDLDRGKTANSTASLLNTVSENIKFEALHNLIKECSDYTAKLPDSDAEDKLNSIDWETENIILFVGRLIASKGLQSIVAALPAILEKAPNTRLVVVGHGPQREVLEILIHSLQTGNTELFNNIVKWGPRLEGTPERSYTTLKHYSAFQDTDNYVRKAQCFLKKNTVVFTGYLTHSKLRYLFPCCDVAVFPSVVAEAGPLVFLEALASGCFPLGTYFAGMAASIDSVAHVLRGDVDVMKISHNEKETVKDIASNVPQAFKICTQYKSDLREVAVQQYDWQNVAKKFANELREI